MRLEAPTNLLYRPRNALHWTWLVKEAAVTVPSQRMKEMRARRRAGGVGEDGVDRDHDVSLGAGGAAAKLCVLRDGRSAASSEAVTLWPTRAIEDGLGVVAEAQPVWRRDAAELLAVSGSGGRQAVGGEDIHGQGEPAHRDLNLGLAAHI